VKQKKKNYEPPEHPSSVGLTRAQRLRVVEPDQPLLLESGATLAPIDIEYEAYGTLNAARDNAVLITHALSGDAHAAGWDDPETAAERPWRLRKPGWWDAIIGPGKAIDTNRWYVLCTNVLGSCYGTTGPACLDPETGQSYGLRFPIVTVGDWVHLQARLLDHLGIERLHAVIGGSLGGQQALEWALKYPDRVNKCGVLAAAARLSAQGLAYNAVGRYSILHDPAFCDGDYYGAIGPNHGLAAARMLAHITYLSEESMNHKFGRRRKGADTGYGFDIEYEVESYLEYQGQTFVQRFDANSYLYITRAMDYYDAAARAGGDLTEACSRLQSQMLVVSFSTDWLYPPPQCRELALAIARNGKGVHHVEIQTRHGHDAFLVETEKVSRLLGRFLTSKGFHS